MPKTVAQWTGVAIAAIIVLGRDSDILFALPLGLVAGALTATFVAIAGWWLPAVRTPVSAK